MDLRLRWGEQGADLEVEGGDLAIDEGLVTPALVGFFTDSRRDPSGSEPVESQDLRGWWGEDDGDRFGSPVWTLSRSKLVPELLERGRAAALEGLRWLVEDGIAASVTVEPSRVGDAVLGLEVELTRNPASRWAPLWEATAETTITTGGVLLDLSAR